MRMNGEIGIDVDLSGNTSSTARHIGRFLHMLYSGKILSSDMTTFLTDTLHIQIFRTRIPAALPHKVVANKTGDWGSASNDAGIVFDTHGNDYVIVVLTVGSPDSTIQEIVQLIDSSF